MDLKSKTKKEAVTCYLAVSQEEKNDGKYNSISEAFKGEVDDNNIRFPKELGAEHPFDFTQVDKILDNVGIADALVDKITDAVIGDFNVKIKDTNSQTLIDELINNSNFKSKIRPWIKEAVSKGNGFLELDLKDIKNIEFMRVMNANNMYVRRNNKGKVLNYNQFKGNAKLYTSKSKVIPFNANTIAHLCINKKPNDPYGRGLLWANRVSIENYAGDEVDKAKLISRKAGAPYHIKLGQPGQKIKPADLDAFKADLAYMNNSTNWVTDPNVEIKVIDFSGIGDNLTKAAEHDLEQIALGMKIPMSLVGISNNPEGLAKTNNKEFNRFIDSVRTLVEEIIENKIFRPYLRSQSPKLDGEVEFEWELPDEEEKNARLDQIKNALGLFDISPELRASLEIEYATIMGLDVVSKLPTPEDARKQADEEKAKLEKEDQDREKEETKIKQPEVPGAKPTAKQSAQLNIKDSKKDDSVVKPTAQNITESKKVELTETQLSNMSVGQYVNLKEIAGFNYSDYLVKILQNLRTDKFEELLALTEQDMIEGLLPKKDINKLRIVLKDGFRKNKTIRQIEKDINQSIDLKDRVKFNEDGSKRVTLSASKRPINIARTETVRLANQGLKEMYIENKIKTYRYLAALDERTTEICQSLDGQVFLTKDGMPGVNMPPMHVNCRSSIVGIVE